MKKFLVEVKESGFLKDDEIDNLCFENVFCDFIIAETEEEALEMAKWFLADMYHENIDAGTLEEIDIDEVIERHAYKVTEA